MMITLFDAQKLSDSRDRDLVTSAQRGSRAALEELIRRHQQWIYNIAFRMVGSPHDAEDVTQEILIKMMTKLSTFEGKSSFRTWLYRIVANHVINMKKRPREYFFSSFERHSSLIDGIHDMEPPDEQTPAADANLLIEETKMSCMMGMLLCLDREQRLVFILGAVLGASSDIGAEILEMSPANFRQKLSRSRKQLGHFMEEKCGLMNEANPCRCARKTRAAIQAGYVDPQHVQFYQEHVEKVKQVAGAYAHKADEALELKAQDLFRDHAFLQSPDHVQFLDNLLRRNEFHDLLNFN